MKKAIIAALLLVVGSSAAQAQNLEEWFQQKKTQKKYLLQQIAALKVYKRYARQGYNIVENGLKTVGGFTRGEYQLHGDYFDKLKQINPAVRHYEKVEQIIQIHQRIADDYKKDQHHFQQSRELSSEELTYINGVYERLLDDCELNLDELKKVISYGEFEMKDNERLKRINDLYEDMKSKYHFSRDFSNGAKVLISARIKERSEIEISRDLHGIK